jgi:hypothetical protein
MNDFNILGNFMMVGKKQLKHFGLWDIRAAWLTLLLVCLLVFQIVPT